MLELWVRQKILRVQYKEQKRNKEILKKMKPNIWLEAATKTLKMRYFGHVRRRKKGQPLMWWMDDVKSVTPLSVDDLNHLLKDRKKWNSLVQNTLKKRIRTNVLSKEKASANNSFENASQYIRKDHQESYKLDGLNHQ